MVADKARTDSPHKGRGSDMPQVSGLEPGSLCIARGLELFPFLGIKDEKMLTPPGIAVGSTMFVCGSVGFRHLKQAPAWHPVGREKEK